MNHHESGGHATAATPRDAVVEAVYEDGVIRPLSPLNIASGTLLRLRISPEQIEAFQVPALPTLPDMDEPTAAVTAATPEPALPIGQAVAVPSRLSTRLRLAEGLRNTWAAHRVEIVLFMVGLLVYGFTRFWEIARFPIYFFCDEAIHTVLAHELFSRGFRDAAGHLLPPYFLNAEKWNLGLSVYLHVLSLPFGRSEEATRGISAFISMLAPVAVALMLKLIFRQRFWWLGALVLALLPAWFLHSRTAFETVMMVSFYAWFLCFYLLYRYRSPWYLFGAVLLGAMTFYSYANGQGVMLISGMLLLLSDWRYHARKWRVVLPAMAVVGLLTVPFFRFRAIQPDALEGQFQALHSYWLEPISLAEKLRMFGDRYLKGLGPAYWFFPNDVDLTRHRMKGMGNLPTIFLPFFVVGLVVALRGWRSSAHRAVLVACLAAPFSSALVDISITRVLAFVIPATILITFGIEQLVRLGGRLAPYRLVAPILTLVFSLMSLVMLRTALADGPTWYTDYGLGGMQYGAPQLFDAIPEILEESPDTQVLLSPTWANNTNIYAPFYLPPELQPRLSFWNVDAFLFHKRPLDQTMLFVMPADEYARAQQSGKFVMQTPERVLAYPDGTPGFYFVRMAYVPHIDDLLAADRLARSQLVSDQVLLAGQVVEVRHSVFDGGQPSDLFDGNPETLVRGMEANPLVIAIDFPEPRVVNTLGMDFGTMSLFEVKVVYSTVAGNTEEFTQRYEGLPSDPHVEIPLPEGPHTLTTLRVEVRDMYAEEPAHVHVRGINVR
jgi:predicted DNA-binding antitoxin AbrB/MazE fold protein